MSREATCPNHGSTVSAGSFCTTLWKTTVRRHFRNIGLQETGICCKIASVIFSVNMAKVPLQTWLWKKYFSYCCRARQLRMVRTMEVRRHHLSQSRFHRSPWSGTSPLACPYQKMWTS